MLRIPNPENRPRIRLETFVDSGGSQHILSTDHRSVLSKLEREAGMHSFRVPNHEGEIQINPNINIYPALSDSEGLEALIDHNGVLTYSPVVVDNYFGTFRSKDPMVSLIIHGSPKDWQHQVLGGFQSVDYFVGLRDYLLSKGIRPPQLFLSCDEQIRADRPDEELKIIFRRFSQDYRYQVLGFPYLLNEISVDNGVITVHEADMKRQAKANSGSSFANPMTEDTHLLDLVVDLFDCPERFLELNEERERIRIHVRG